MTAIITRSQNQHTQFAHLGAGTYAINTQATQEPLEQISTPNTFSTQETISAPKITKEQEIDSNQQSLSLKEFITKKLPVYTTYSSALVNMISVPIHLFEDSNPLKKIINKISMIFTKVRLGTYSLSGIITALKQKNPFLIFSFSTEGVAAFLGLRKIYMFRGIATGIDGAVTGIKDKYKKSEFDSYKEAWDFTIKAVKESSSELLKKLSKNPLNIFKLDGIEIAIFASLIAAMGGFMGMTVNEKIFGAIRDIFGGLGDIGIFKLDNPLAKNAGFGYLSGTLMDLTARVFNKSIASILNIKDTNAFERLRDSFHEAAIGLDSIGSIFFLKYNQENDKDLKLNATKTNNYSKDLHLNNSDKMLI
ncbi:MAG: hypothetical protein RLZZ361_49 [Cyanobacteriota bacterium]|jgi:hypothetical protein